MEDYEIKLEENEKRNELFINKFESWLIDKGLVKKTIKKHLNNIELFLNNYLVYSDISTMEEGVDDIDMFLGDWFIRKCMWSSKNSIKETASSIKKFYQCMSEYEYISKEDYKSVCETLKDNMEDYLESMDDYDNGNYYYF